MHCQQQQQTILTRQHQQHQHQQLQQPLPIQLLAPCKINTTHVSGFIPLLLLCQTLFSLEEDYGYTQWYYQSCKNWVMNSTANYYCNTYPLITKVQNLEIKNDFHNQLVSLMTEYSCLFRQHNSTWDRSMKEKMCTIISSGRCKIEECPSCAHNFLFLPCASYISR